LEAGRQVGVVGGRLKKKVKALTPDTNFWLHARLPFDFAMATGSADTVVVVPHVVLSELDKRQHEGRRQAKTRARERVMAFRKLMATGTQKAFGFEATDRDGVIYWLVPTPAEASGSADDKIVATAARLVGAHDVAVLTADASMEMTARLAGLQVISVPEEMLEQSGVDPLEQEVAQLKREVRKLRSPQAIDVSVKAEQLWPKQAPTTLIRLGMPSVPQLEEIRRAVVRSMTYQPVGREPDALSKYHIELPAYADAFALYVEAAARYNALAEAAVEVQLLVTNRAAEPVADAVIEISAPAGISLAYPPTRPTVPKAPTRPGDVDGSPFRPPRAGGLISTTFHTVPPPTAPRVRVEKHWAEVKLGEPLRPEYPTFGGRLWVGLGPEHPEEDIRLPYVLYAAVAGHPMKGVIVVPVRHMHEQWEAPTLPSYLNPKVQASLREDQKLRQIKADLSLKG
jgi:rRNA-processing protein FCF1